MLAQDRDEIIVGIALVQEHGLAEPERQFQLQVKRPLLRGARGVVAVVVQATLAHRDHFRAAGELLEFPRAHRIKLCGVVRVHACGGEQAPRVRPAERARLRAAGKACARDDHLRNACRLGTRDHRVTVCIEAVVSEVDADVDEGRGLGRGARRGGCDIVRHVHTFYRKYRSNWRQAALLSAIVLSIGAGAAHAEDAQWGDAESRIQYGYFTEDPRALQNMADAIAAGEAHDQWHSYYAGLAYWRLAQLAVLHPQPKGATAAQLADRCVHALDAAIEAQADFAEGLALRAMCAVTPLAQGGLHVPFAGHRPRKDLDRALELAPRNPRVLLALALADYQYSAPMDGEKERAIGELRHAVAAFEAERGGTESFPGWGASEAYFYLGRDLLEHGDPVGARDALEHALLLAPDYTQARHLLAKITAG